MIAALGYVAAGAILASAVALLLVMRNDTTDAREFFTTRADAYAYQLAQEEAGYDCWVHEKHGGWEVRCYLRGRHQ